jgi:uncharacterized membrane protein HdeD (DUF308 family)
MAILRRSGGVKSVYHGAGAQEAVMSINSINESDANRFRRAAHDHWVLFLVEGVVLVVLGATAIVIPVIATLAATVVLGWLFLVSGIMGLVSTFWMRQAPGFWWALISAALGIVVGALLLASPLRGAVTLTIVLVAFFIIEGVASIMFALEHKRQLSGRWGWMLVSGIVDLVLGAMIFAGLPSTAAWAIGLLVGINMVFGGTALVAMAVHARDAAPGA